MSVYSEKVIQIVATTTLCSVPTLWHRLVNKRSSKLILCYFHSLADIHFITHQVSESHYFLIHQYLVENICLNEKNKYTNFL